MRKLRFAIILDYVFSTYQSVIRWGVERYARQNDIQTVYFGVGSLNPNIPDAIARERLFEIIRPAEYDGLLIVSATLMQSHNQERIRDWLKTFAGLPMVAIGPAVGDEPAVLVNGKAGMRDLVLHMIRQHGYRDLAFISGPFANPESIDRLEVYKACLADNGIEFDAARVYEGNFRQASGKEAVTEFFDARGLRPRAIVCANDVMAIGAWKNLRARGLSIPQDIAVTGFDDLQILRMVSHQFTTVRQPFEEQAWQAARLLHQRIRGNAADPPPPLPSELRIRTSCGCIAPDRRLRKNAPANSAEGCALLSKRLEAHVGAGITGLETDSLC